MMRSSAAAILLLGAPLLAAPVPKELKKEFKVEGTWEMVSIDSYGRKLALNNALHWTFDDKGNMRSHVGPTPAPNQQSILQFTFHLEDKTVEYRSTNGQRVCPGVFEFDGDTLKICCNMRTDERPKVVEAAVDTYVWSLKRAKESK